MFSINVQTVSDTDLKILNIVARWPGSSHDSTIFSNSRICTRFENNEFGNNLIVADSGYPNKPFMLTPLAVVTTPAEHLYNESLIRTRNCVERSYGVWKRRFPILSLGMRLKLEKVQSIIVATAVLHNICCMCNDTAPPCVSEEVESIINSTLSIPPNRQRSTTNFNNYTRRTIINYFENLTSPS